MTRGREQAVLEKEARSDQLGQWRGQGDVGLDRGHLHPHPASQAGGLCFVTLGGPGPQQVCLRPPSGVWVLDLLQEGFHNACPGDF